MEPSSQALALLEPATLGAIAAIVLLLAVSAFLSGSETALATASRSALHALADRGDRGARRAYALTEDKERLLGGVLLGNNLVATLAAALATTLFTARFGAVGVLYAALTVTLLTLIFGEVLPKTYAVTDAAAVAARVARPIGLVVAVTAPIVGAVRATSRLILRIFGVRIDPKAPVLAAQEIAGAIALHHAEGAVETADRDLLLGALDLGQRAVEEVMMHRQDIETLDADAPPAEILTAALNSPHTRLPIFRGEPENIVGVIHAKDLSRAVEKLIREAEGGAVDLARFDVMAIAMPPYFVPETTPLDEQMREFLRRRTHFALVVDEYGALKGLITLEDIIEEIVGDITDEHDVEAPGGLQPLPDGSIEVEGVVTIRDLNRACDWSLPDDEANTVAGLVIHEAQAIPEAGQVFSFHGFRFEVLERENNRLKRLRIRKLV